MRQLQNYFNYAFSLYLIQTGQVFFGLWPDSPRCEKHLSHPD